MIIEKQVDFMWNDPCRFHVECPKTGITREGHVLCLVCRPRHLFLIGEQTILFHVLPVGKEASGSSGVVEDVGMLLDKLLEGLGRGIRSLKYLYSSSVR